MYFSTNLTVWKTTKVLGKTIHTFSLSSICVDVESGVLPEENHTYYPTIGKYPSIDRISLF